MESLWNRPVGRACGVALAALMLLTAPPASAQAQITTTAFVMDAISPVATAPAIASKRSTLLALSVRGERAVRLEADLDATATNWLGAKLKRPMLRGQVLVAAADRRGVFCAPVKEGAWYSVSPCLTDADGDGRFEALGTAAFNSGSVDGLMVTDRGAVLGVRFSETTPLGAPVAYTAVDYSEGAAGEARLKWSSSFKRDQAGPGIIVKLWLEASDSSSGTGVLSRTVEARLPQGTGLVEVEGIKVRVLGFEPNGAMHYQIESVVPSRPVTLAFRPAPTVIYIYY